MPLTKYGITKSYARSFIMIPKDPIMLLSYINLKLRDEYSSLDDCVDSLDLDKAVIIDTLRVAGYEYNEELNQFR